MKKIVLSDKVKKNIQFSLRIVLIVIISFVFGLAIYSWNLKSLRGDVFPMPFGIGMGVVKTGSMRPTITESDLIIVKKTDDYIVDDIVVYQSNSDLVVHRIIRIEGDLIYTQGDNNSGEDAPIKKDQIKGEVIHIEEGIGVVIKFIKSPMGVILILGSAVLLLVMSYKKEKEESQDKLDSLKQEIRKLREEIKK